MTTNTIYETGFGSSELGQKAKALYERNIAPTLTEADFGKYLVIDTETGDYELDSSDYAASHRAFLKRPGVRTRYGARIGYRAVYNSWRVRPAPDAGTP